MFFPPSEFDASIHLIKVISYGCNFYHVKIKYIDHKFTSWIMINLKTTNSNLISFLSIKTSCKKIKKNLKLNLLKKYMITFHECESLDLEEITFLNKYNFNSCNSIFQARYR